MAAKLSVQTTSSFFLVLCLTVFTLSCFADPDELQDFCPVSEVTSNDFFYSGLVNQASTDNPLRVGVRLGDVNNFPGLNTLGLSINRADFAPGGIIPLHTHPRASETVFIIKGQILIGFISTTNVLYSKVLKAGEMFIVPKGLVHFLKNVGPGKATGLAIFNSQLPGTAILANNLFGSNPTIPNDILAMNFQVDEKIIKGIKSKFVLCLTVFALSCFADPDQLQDFCVADLNTTTTIVNGFPCKPVSQVTSNDFFFSGLVNEASTDNPFGLGVRFGDVENFPGLNTLGLSINRAHFAPGGIIPIHTHPRANEANFVIKGNVRFGFITTTNVLYSKVLKAGEMAIVPKGLVHFVQNVGSGKADILAVFDSQLPGTASLPFNLFGSTPALPDDLLAKNFQVDEKVIASIKSKFGN
ncbi:hypothetical protein MKX01_020537 [Papaver californicum]|nr:hypothetical protein MKX01_020537 [Papaver californicum]